MEQILSFDIGHHVCAILPMTPSLLNAGLQDIGFSAGEAGK